MSKRKFAFALVGLVGLGCNLVVGISGLPEPADGGPDATMDATRLDSGLPDSLPNADALTFPDGSVAITVTVTGLLAGNSVQLQAGAGVRTVSANGAAMQQVSLPAAVLPGGTYLVTLVAPPSPAPEICALSGNMGHLTDDAVAPTVTVSCDTAVSVAAGGDFTCALRPTAGDVVCWGANEQGEIGNNTRLLTAFPSSVSGIEGATAIAAGTAHACALEKSGSVFCWGDGAEGQLGYANGYDAILEPAQAVSFDGGDSFIAVAAGGNHTCAIVNNGSPKTGGPVLCWGDNANGDLGNGGQDPSDVPVQVMMPDGSAFLATFIAAGSSNNCAIVPGDAGSVACWGNNSSGQSSTSTDTIIPYPSVVPGVSGATSVAIGDDTSCAVVAGGSMFCWGNDQYGQLGVGSANNGSNPAALASTHSPVAAADLGSNHTCARFTNGTAACWGAGYQGQLGNGNQSLDGSVDPQIVSGVMGVTSIAAGAYHTCVVADGGVLCWGLDSYGQAGPVNTVEEAVASPVKPQPGSVTGVTCGSYYTCAALADGGADCWGDNLQAELGNGNENQANSPVGVVDLPFPVATVSAGEATTCAFLRNATVACWGHGTQGELGSGTAAIQSVPSNVPGLNGAVSLSSGAQFSCVVQSDGGVTCWGFNGFGELANGTVPDGGSAQGPPLPVVGLGGPVAKIAAGGDHACALLQDGTVECWGNNDAGEVGTGSAGGTVLTPTRLAPLQGIADIAAGANHVCAVEKDGGAVECWGNNQFGQIGVGTLMDYPSPTPVPGVQGANAIFAGSNHTCVRLPGGSLECWGDNRYGQLGIGTYGTTRGNIDYVITPTRVAGLQGVTSACGGSSHTCAVVNGNVQCWGGNFDGQLGIGAPSQVNLPAAVP